MQVLSVVAVAVAVSCIALLVVAVYNHGPIIRYNDVRNKYSTVQYSIVKGWAVKLSTVPVQYVR